MKNSDVLQRSALIAGLTSIFLGSSVALAQEQQQASGEDVESAAAVEETQAPSPRAERRPRRGARQEIELQTTSVSGNRELPRVMVVVPWKSAAPAELGGRPIVSLVEEALAPVDPEVFRRELEYFGLLHGGPGEDAAESAKTANNLTEE